MLEQNDAAISSWVEGDLKLAGMLDSRMIALLQAIDQTGSINRAAKQVGLSYKGAWQIIERANNGSPKMLVSTSIGGSKGGGTHLTDAGQALVALFLRLECQHQQFLDQLNRDLNNDPDTLLLLQRLIVKTSARNQLFGQVVSIQPGAVNAEVVIKLRGGEQVIVTISLSSIESLNLSSGCDALLLINNADLVLTTEDDHRRFLSTNHLACRVLRLQQDEVTAEVIVQLSGGEILAISMTPQSIREMAIETGQALWVVFNSNAPFLGVRT